MTFVRNPDGSYLATVDCLFTGAQDPLSTGVATMTLSIDADAATSNAVALAQGDPGMPSTIRNVIVTNGTAGSAGSGTVTLVSPGGAGTSSVYDVNLTVPVGAPGSPGATGHILGSSDFSNSPADGQVPVYNAAGTNVAWTSLQPKRLLYVVPGSSFTSLSMTSAGTSGILTNITIPAQTFAYRPRVEGDVEVTPSATGTRIDTEIRMGLSTSTPSAISASGTLIGYGRGVESNNVAVHVAARPRFGVSIAPTDVSPAAVVPAGQAETVVFSAVRQYGSANWGTSQTLAELQIWLDPA